MTESVEKRRHPRVLDRLTIRSSAPGYDPAEMITTNLSLGGACVVSRRFLPLMTRVEVTLHLPPESEAEARPRAVKAEAVVVRVEPAQPSPDDVAVTRRLQLSALILGLDLHDHLIAGESGQYFSFREGGLLGTGLEEIVAACGAHPTQDPPLGRS